MNKKLIKTTVGYTPVVIFIRDGQGGEFAFASALDHSDGNISKITIGLDYDSFHGVIGTLVHELWEFSASQNGVRFVMDSGFAVGSDMYRFMCDHNEFTTICQEVSVTLEDVYSDLKKAYRKHKK